MAVFCAACSLLAAPALAFRTAADDPDFEGTKKVRWAEDLISYRLHSTLPPGISAGELERTVQSALDRWSESANSRVVFRFSQATDEDAAAGDGINTIQFLTNGWEVRGFDPNAPGITDVQYAEDANGKWVIVEADLYLNAETHAWVASGEANDGRRALDSVLTHEGGHMLGLFHPCEVGSADSAPDCDSDASFAEAAMYPVYAPSQSKLGEDDIAGVEFLYPGSSCEVSGCPQGSVCQPEGCLEECSAYLCGPDEHCTPDGCWPDDQCYGPRCDLVCARDSDCARGQVCVSNQCSGTALAGDPCDESRECDSGLCTQEGACVASCKDCEGGACVREADGNVSCEVSRQPLGAVCSAPEECLGGECLVGAEPKNVCTRQCIVGAASCPEGWDCTSVEGANVCAPKPSQAKDAKGCAVAGASGESAPRGAGGALVLLTVAGGLAARRSRARGPKLSEKDAQV